MVAVEKKGVGINPLSQVHYLDHLAVVCILMEIPLLLTEPCDAALASKLYPGLNCHLVDYKEMQPEFLAANYDVLFMSDLWDRYSFHEKFCFLEKKYDKQLRHVHCPHGFSDKGYYLKKCAYEDILLVYGKNMLNLLKEEGVYEHLSHHVVTGNYRLSYYLKNKDFYDALIDHEVLSRFAKRQPIILYAPTWLDLGPFSSFYEAASVILDTLPEGYNLIVKPHPRLADDAARYQAIASCYEKRPNIIFLEEFPLIYPLLSSIDLFIGDASAVGYDFLYFNRPMIFLSNKAAPQSFPYLWRCGRIIGKEQLPMIYRCIDEVLACDEECKALRDQVYHYTFGPAKEFACIKDEIIAAYNAPLGTFCNCIDLQK